MVIIRLNVGSCIVLNNKCFRLLAPLYPYLYSIESPKEEPLATENLVTLVPPYLLGGGNIYSTDNPQRVLGCLYGVTGTLSASSMVYI